MIQGKFGNKTTANKLLIPGPMATSGFCLNDVVELAARNVNGSTMHLKDRDEALRFINVCCDGLCCRSDLAEGKRLTTEIGEQLEELIRETEVGLESLVTIVDDVFVEVRKHAASDLAERATQGQQLMKVELECQQLMKVELECQQLKARIAELDDELGDVSASRSNSSDNEMRLAVEISRISSQVDSDLENLERRRGEIKCATATLERRDLAAKERGDRIGAKESDLDMREAKANLRSINVDERNAVLKVTSASLSKVEEATRHKKTIVDSVASDLAKRDEVVRGRTSDLTKRENKLCARVEQLHEREEGCALLESRLDARKAAIERLVDAGGLDEVVDKPRRPRVKKAATHKEEPADSVQLEINAKLLCLETMVLSVETNLCKVSLTAR